MLLFQDDKKHALFSPRGLNQGSKFPALQSDSTVPPKIVTIGCGMSGLVAAIFLARRGFSVSIFEKRPEPASVPLSNGRSMNLTLCERGLKVLAELGIRDGILAKAVTLVGRAIHRPTGTTSFHEYGISGKEALYSIRRSDLINVLLEEANRYPNIKIRYAHTLASINKGGKEVLFSTAQTNQESKVAYDLLVGADGVFSEVRSQMQSDGLNALDKRYSSWGYKELIIEADDSSSLTLAGNRLHVWSRLNALLIGIPNSDKSITCNLFMPLSDQDSFQAIGDVNCAHTFLVSHFPDLSRVASKLALQLFEKPVSEMVSVQADQWRYEDSIVLVGDASHGVFPFLGQGVNAAFEDCSALNQCLTVDKTIWGESLKTYEQLQRPNAEALSILVDEHFQSLQSNIGSRFFTFQKLLHNVVTRATLSQILPIYSLIAHTNIPYSTILRRLHFRRRVMLLLRTFFIIVPFLVLCSMWGAM